MKFKIGDKIRTVYGQNGTIFSLNPQGYDYSAKVLLKSGARANMELEAHFFEDELRFLLSKPKSHPLTTIFK